MGKDLSQVSTTFYFCDGGSCRRAGSEQVIRAARAYLRNNDFWDQTHTIRTRCNGRCENAPTCIVQPGNYWYKKLSSDKILNILEGHIFDSKPSIEDLLYGEGFEKMVSEKERAQVMPKPFKEVEDEAWGTCWETKGFSSDQYLYPLFLFLQRVGGDNNFQIENGRSWKLNELVEVDYTHDYQLKLVFSSGETILNIGSVPKTAALKEQEAKITGSFYSLRKDTGEKKLYFKNKMGQLVATVYLSSSETVLWDYFVKIQLKGIEVPQL